MVWRTKQRGRKAGLVLRKERGRRQSTGDECQAAAQLYEGGRWERSCQNGADTSTCTCCSVMGTVGEVHSPQMPRWIQQVTAVPQQCSPQRTGVVCFCGRHSFRQNGVWDLPGTNDLGMTLGWPGQSCFPGAISGCSPNSSWEVWAFQDGLVPRPSAKAFPAPSGGQVTALSIFEKVLLRLKHPGFLGHLSPPPGTHRMNWRTPLHPPG